MSAPSADTMPPRPLAALLEGLPDTRVIGDRGVSITGVVYDSRAVQPGNLFVALRGGYADGHRFVANAAGRGAVAVLAEHAITPLPQGVAAVAVVPDSRAALARVAANWYAHPADDLIVIGVTGTNGKTTVATMIALVLDAGGMTSGMLGTVEMKLGAARWPNPNHQTTPESLGVQGFLRQCVAAGCTHAILEATSHGLATHRLDALPCDIAVFTNISHEHLEFHKTFDNYLAAKRALFERLDAFPARDRPRFAIVNAEDAHADAFLRASARAEAITYAITRTATVTATEITAADGATHFTLRTPRGAAPARLATMGRYNTLNALAAAAVGHATGMAPDAIAAGLAAFYDVAGHLEQIAMGQPFAVIVDFAHTPVAFEALLNLLRETTAGKLTVVFGSAGERDTAKRAMQGAITARIADRAIFTDEDPRFEDRAAILRAIAAGAEREGWREGVQYWCVVDRREAIARAVAMAKPGDTVALVGKGHENSIIIGADAVPWDEAAEARAALRALGWDGRTED